MKWLYILFFFYRKNLTYYNLNTDIKSYDQLCRKKVGKLKQKFDKGIVNYRTNEYESIVTNRGDLLSIIFGDMDISIVKHKITSKNYNKVLRFLNVWTNEGDNKFFLPKLYDCEYNTDINGQIDYVYYAQSAIQEDAKYEIKTSSDSAFRFKQQYFPVRYRKYRDLFLSLREIHNKGLVHGNITPECIFSSEPLNIKGINYFTEHEWDFYIGGYENMKNIGEPMETNNIYFLHPDMKNDNSAKVEYDIYMLSLSILVIESYKYKQRDRDYLFVDLNPFSNEYILGLKQEIKDLFLIDLKLQTNEGLIQQFSDCRNLSCFLYFAINKDINKIPTAEEFRKALNELVILHDASHELKRIVKQQADITKDNDDIEDLDLEDTDPFNITIVFGIVSNNKQIQKIKQRRLQPSWRNINIKLDFYNTQETESDMHTFIEKTIFTRVQQRLESMIQVQGEFLIQPFQSCSRSIQVPNTYLATQKTDLIIFVKTVNEASDYAAYAAVCQGGSDNRPTVGYIVINTRRMEIKTSKIEQYELIFIHEIFHIMVLNPDILKMYPVEYQVTKKETRVSGAGSLEVTKLVTPRIVKEAQNHFGCSSISGLYLENEGTSSAEGSHFDQKHFGNEIMTSKKIGNSVLSRFIFALMEDSSWYKVDYSKAQKFYFGKNTGCGFYQDQTCSENFREFCQKRNKLGCSRGYLSKTVCQYTQFTDKCMINVPQDNYNCHNKIDFQETTKYEQTGAYSRCFETVDSIKESSGCYKSSCKNGQLKVEVQGKNYECISSGAIIVVDQDLQIICPNIEEFCSYINDSCVNDCNGNGVCLINNQCRCNYFYQGYDCSQQQDCHNGDNSICHLLVKPFNISNENYTKIFNIIYFMLFVINFL